MNFSLIFDLDGTLVDSSSGILASLSFAFAVVDISPVTALTPRLIGPPLREALCLLCPNANAKVLDELAANFKTHYDTTGFQQTNPFPGVEPMLRSLVDAKIGLHIATNKRQRPTSQIVNSLGWSALFDLVLSPDSFDPALLSKAAILTKLLAKANLDAEECLYIGDRLDDYNAAQEIGIPFAMAKWGFEGDDSELPPDAIRMQTPDADQLMAYFIDRARR